MRRLRHLFLASGLSLLASPPGIAADAAAPAQAAKQTPAPGSISENATGPDSTLPAVQMFVPGFVVREIPVHLTNQNNVEYAPDGRLFTSGYDGRVHLLRDTDGDGLEDSITTLWEKTSGDYSLGMTFREGALYVMFRNEVARFRDTDGDGVPETRETAISNWDDPVLDKAKLILHRRVDYGIGLAIGPDGSFYVGMGSAAYRNPYRRDTDGVVHYKPMDRRGCILRISVDGSKIEQIASGVRYSMSLQFNRHGDLFASDQEGATWLPNGNPFDELLHIQIGRHYGFPARHPQYLPGVIDEPSVVDYAPQHQSICGFRFNDSGPGRVRFGPEEWEGDAILTGQSRGKLFRTSLVKTAAGYVAQNHLIAALQALPVDCTISPRGDLLVAAHTGKPDWGSGPQGIGRLFKISYRPGTLAKPAFAYTASPNEVRVEFDRALSSDTRERLSRQISLRSGRHVSAGDHFEKTRPGYAVVQAQQSDRPIVHRVENTSLSAGGRTMQLRTPQLDQAVNFSLSLRGDPVRARTSNANHTLGQEAAIELGFDLTGVEAEWTPRIAGPESAARGAEPWKGWLPHVDLNVARHFTRASGNHRDLFARLNRAGALKLRGQLDLARMLQPDVQAGSSLDFEYPPERVTVELAANGPLRVEVRGTAAKVMQVDTGTVRLVAETNSGSRWLSFEAELAVAGTGVPNLDVHWFTTEDPRPRAMPLRRFFVPWAKSSSEAIARRTISEIADGNWEAGKKLYFGAAACSVCHAIRGQGAAVGPDLTNLVHRDYASVMKDIVDPNATINPDHVGYIVELNDGQSLAGTIAGDTADEVRLTEISGLTTSFVRARVRSITPMTTSLMPAGLMQSLQPDQIRDLMRFLLQDSRQP